MRKQRFVKYRRKREGRTDYARRLELLKSQKLRLVIRKQLNNTIVQFVRYTPAGDIVLGASDARQLEKMGWKGHKGNLSSSYLAGLLCGVKFKKDVKEAVLDTGLSKLSLGSGIYAALKGVLDAGVHIPHSDKILPSEEVVQGNSEVSKHFHEIKQKVLEQKND